MSKLAYFEWSAPDDASHDAPEAWAQANPALGIRISEDFIDTERGALEPEDFARERLGIFPEDIDASEPAIDPDDWRTCAKPDSKRVDPVVFAFEVSTDRKWSVIAVASTSTLGGLHVEVVESRRRTSWVVDRLIELRDKYHPTAIVCNPNGPAGALLTECTTSGLVVGIPDPEKPGKFRPATTADYAQACGAAYDDITEGRWCHIDQPVLNVAVTGASKRTTGDTWVFDRRTGVDISPLVAVALAALVARKPGEAIPKEADFILI